MRGLWPKNGRGATIRQREKKTAQKVAVVGFTCFVPPRRLYGRPEYARASISLSSHSIMEQYPLPLVTGPEALLNWPVLLSSLQFKLNSSSPTPSDISYATIFKETGWTTEAFEQALKCNRFHSVYMHAVEYAAE